MQSVTRRYAVITLANGYEWGTGINGTVDEITAYFLGRLWPCEAYPSEKCSKCVKVVIDPV